MEKIIVKICGLTNLADARVAAAAGADLLGFIFYAKSPRYVAPETVATIVRALREEERETRGQSPSLQRAAVQSSQPPMAPDPRTANRPLPKFVGVFVNVNAAEIGAIVDQVGLDFVQLHGNETAAWFAPLAGRAFKAVQPADAEAAQALAAQFAPLGCQAGPALLIDAYDPQAYGGTGKQTDWHVAAAIARQYPGLLLAGGLTPANVAAAIARVRPWGVDVGSGVEAEPGRKDHDKVRQFVAAVRTSS